MCGLPAAGHVRHGPLLTAKRPTLPSMIWLAVASPVPIPAIRNRGTAAIPRNFDLTLCLASIDVLLLRPSLLLLRLVAEGEQASLLPGRCRGRLMARLLLAEEAEHVLQHL